MSYWIIPGLFYTGPGRCSATTNHNQDTLVHNQSSPPDTESNEIINFHFTDMSWYNLQVIGSKVSLHRVEQLVEFIDVGAGATCWVSRVSLKYEKKIELFITEYIRTLESLANQLGWTVFSPGIVRVISSHVIVELTANIQQSQHSHPVIFWPWLCSAPELLIIRDGP